MSHKLVLISFILALLTSQLVRSAQIGLRVSPSAESVNQPSNQQFVVTCRGFGAEPPLFSNLRWYDPRGQEIDSSYSRLINPDIKVEEVEVGALLLHFLNPSPDNSGQYRCAATFQHSDSLETKIQITFFQDVQWEDCPSIQSLVLGSTNERIRCKASANPKPSITWSKDDSPLERRFQIDANGVALTDAVRDTDGGVFRVRALVTETGRLHDAFITVQVYVRAHVTALPQRFEGTENEETTLKCEARGTPQPLITWLDPNKRNLSSVGGYAVDRNSGALIISRVKKVDDSGVFTCIAENDAGIDQKTTTLVVSRRPTITSFRNESFDQNSQSILECRSTGDPPPTMTIRRDGDSRELNTGDSGVTLESSRQNDESVLKLILSQTRRSDDGLYFCRANNSGGVVERSGHLEVRFAPDLSRTPLTSVKSWNLEPINVTCIADAIPNATIRWIFRGEVLRNDIDFTIVDSQGISRLIINAKSQREIFGQYRCLALNSLGESETRIQVERAHRPGAVLQTTQERVTPTTVLFRVMKPSFDGGLAITQMHVQYSIRSGSHSNNEILKKSWPLDKQDLYFLDNLFTNTKYSFKFAAENVVGIGDWSVEREVWTERESRPEKPEFRNLPLDPFTKEVVSPFGDQFMATWTLPRDNGRKIKFFEIQYFRVRKTDFGFESEEEAHVTTVSMNDQSMTSLTLRSLRANSYYKLEIRANNELGYSDVTQLVFKTSNDLSNPSEESHVSTAGSSGASVALIAGIALAVIILLLLATDAFFFFRYKVGAIYFLSGHVFPSRDVESPSNGTEVAKGVTRSEENRGFERRFENEPFVRSRATNV